MPLITLRADRSTGSFTIDPTTLVIRRGDTIRWTAECVGGNDRIDRLLELKEFQDLKEGYLENLENVPWTIQFIGKSPLRNGHMLMRKDKQKILGSLEIDAKPGRYDYAAAITDGRWVFIHTSGEIIVDPGNGIG